MQQFINYTFSGLTTASIYAIAAMGLVLTYTTTGVFNFSHGAMGMLAAFSYWQLRFGWNWPAPIAFVVVVLLIAPLFGALLEAVIMRRLDGTSATTKLVVTISLLLSFLGLSAWVWNPLKNRPLRRFFEGDVVHVLGVRLPYHQVFALLFAGVVAIGLRVLLYRSRLGIAMRACVDDRNLAALNGVKPNRVSMASWSIGASLAALSGVLVSPTIALSGPALTLLIINTYAAAIIGRLRNLPMTFVGALILGLANDYSRGYANKINIDVKYISGALASTSIIVLFIVLLLLPQSRLRGLAMARVRESSPKPSRGGALGFALAIVAGAVMVSSIIPKGNMVNVSQTWGLAIIALSMIPLIGYAGQISLCQLSFAGIGIVVMQHLGNHGSPWAFVAAIIITSLVGVVVALPSLRLSGIYLALSTAAFAVFMDKWVFQFPKFTLFGHSFDISNSGSFTIKSTHLFGIHVQTHRDLFIFGSVAFALAALAVAGVRRSHYGQRLIALKDSEAACATLGMNPKVAKLTVFALSAGIAGFGGAIYGQALRAPSLGQLEFLQGLSILMVMVIGGLNSMGAAVFTGIFMASQIFQNLFPGLTQLQLVTIGLAGIGLGKNPNGFIRKDIRPRWNVMLKYPAAIAAVVGVQTGIWVLKLNHIITRWQYAIAALAALAIAPEVLSAVLRARPVPTEATTGAAVEVPAARSAPVSPEWLGIDAPFTQDAVDELDRRLNLPTLGLR